MEDYVEEFEPLDYEAELLKFCNVLDQNKIKFQNKTQDETILNSEIMDNLEKLSEAIAALDEATNQKENVRLKTSNEEKNLEDILNEVKAISKREQTTKKKLLGISETVEKKKSELHTKRNQNASSSDLYKEKQNVMSSELEKWKKTLGLELIRSTHEGLIFKFTNVQRDDPDKIFTCELSGIYLLFSNAHCGIGVKSAPLFFLMFPGNFLVVRIVILEGPVKEFSKKNHARHRAGQKPIKNFTLLNN